MKSTRPPKGAAFRHRLPTVAMPHPGYEDVVLITGFPALQARKLLEHVLEAEPGTLVYAVVLRRLMGQAEAALAALSESHRARVVMLEGDAAAMDLGLSGAEFNLLASEVDRIHHVAHVNYVGIERQAAEYANLRGVVEAAELGRAASHLRCLVHHSTAHVSGDRSGIVYEDELDRGQSFHSLVQETRMKAEKIMRRAMGELPVAVVRPTMLVGDSGTGEADHFDGPYLLIMLILGLPGDIAVPLPEPADSPLNIVPVDYVVKAARAVGLDPRAPGRTFHLASPEPLTAEYVFNLIAQAGGRRTVRSYIPTQVARILLSTPGVERLLHKPLEFVQQLTSPAEYDIRNTRSILDGTDIQCPPLSSYVDNLVARVQEYLKERRKELESTLEEVEDPLF